MTIGLGPKIRMERMGVYLYWCPGCLAAHRFNISAGDHPDGLRWGWDGDGHHPTIEPDMAVDGDGTRCHHYLRGGRLYFFGDCSHALAGRMVALPDFPMHSVEADPLPADTRSAP
jgi:hypothetical protein